MSGRFDDICGIFTAEKSVSLEEMDQAISKHAQEKFISAVECFEIGWQEIQRGEYHPIETLWDDIDL